jgi:methylphosphotriester-DNA--protein-cysteine methyltransferase
MGYDRARIASLVRSRLQRHPLTSLAVLAAELSVDRHTIARALQAEWKMSYRRLQGESIAAAVLELQKTRVLSQKEIATQLGFASYRTFRRRVPCLRELPTRPRITAPDD